MTRDELNPRYHPAFTAKAVHFIIRNVDKTLHPTAFSGTPLTGELRQNLCTVRSQPLTDIL